MLTPEDFEFSREWRSDALRETYEKATAAATRIREEIEREAANLKGIRQRVALRKSLLYYWKPTLDSLA